MNIMKRISQLRVRISGVDVSFILALCVLLGTMIVLFCNFLWEDTQHKKRFPDGSFVLTADGVKEDFTDKNNRKYDWYFDPYCMDCIRVEEEVEDSVREKILSGEIEVKYHPLNFLSRSKGNNGYSEFISASILHVAKRGNTRDTLDIISQVMTEDTLKNVKQGKKTKEEVITDLFTTPSKEDIEQVNRASLNIRRDPDLRARSPKEDHSFYTPFIFRSDKQDSKAYVTETDDLTEVKNGLCKEDEDKILDKGTEISNCQTDAKVSCQ